MRARSWTDSNGISPASGGRHVTSQRAKGRLLRAFLRAGALCVAFGSVNAQVDPSATWRTIETPHFRVTFTSELEPIARRAATHAEQAYVALATRFRPPRGKVDIVVADNVDFSNGSASAFPSNRIVVYANPPITSGSLRFSDDPVELVVTHELLHIFQLDRSSGLWGVAQKLFGRSPYLFPNAYQPSWLLEGMAVRYESALTGSGRLVGREHAMIARTAALSNALPRIDQLSLANPRFPYGYSTYAYGSLFMDWLGDRHGDSAMTKYVEASSRNLIPLWLDPPARKAFGRSMSRAYREWTRSLLDSLPPMSPPTRDWRDLTVEGGYANHPRWLDDSTLVYVGTSGRESYALHRLRLRDGRVARERVARRHTAAPSNPRADGALVYSQLEYADPYTLRSDIYIDEPGRGARRLTRNARLAMPDARADGLMVAMQTVPGATRLALVSADGRAITPITSAADARENGDSLPLQWAEPRWSPDGGRIAAIRWRHGGVSDLVVLDTAGRVQATLFSARAVVAAPSWSADGRSVYFSADHLGTSNLFRVPADGTGAPQQVTHAATGLFEPAPSRDDSLLAAVIFRADGYHVGVTPQGPRAPAPEIRGDSTARTRPDPSPVISDPSSQYSPWRSLRPRYWLPYFSEALTPDSWRLGAFTSGADLVGRHAYQALLYVPTDNSGITGSLYYRNARLGQPVVELLASQDWENYRGIFNDQNARVGTLRRRIRDGAATLSLQRPRARTSSYLSLGGGVEARTYATDPAPLLAQIAPVFRGVYYHPRVTLSMGWSNTQSPPLAISPEDGISLAATGRYRWRTGDTLRGTHSVIGSASAFKSLDLPGFAHHVAALRVAAGQLDNRGTGYLEVGGVSGGVVDVLPGYSLGEGRRTFQVRGFPAASLLGMRAVGANLEYRAPLLLPGRGLGTLPLFLDRTSITVFGDAGTAWCPGLYPARALPNTSICSPGDFNIGRTVAPQLKPLIYTEPQYIASAGAELNVNAAVLSWDAPFRYRLGAAAPVVGRHLVADVKPLTVYFTVGASF